MPAKFYYCVRSLMHAYPCETLEEARRVLPQLCERSRRAYTRLFHDAAQKTGLISDHQTGIYLDKHDLPSYLEATASRSTGWAVTRLSDDPFHIFAECQDNHLKRLYWEIRPQSGRHTAHPPACAIIEHVTEHELIASARSCYRLSLPKASPS
ncbi:MAG: hypothetical protein IKY83_12660 [Proteobacteria bacterium]|nr:hypothetical protein [Pseudomonadota bacterium]